MMRIVRQWRSWSWSPFSVEHSVHIAWVVFIVSTYGESKLGVFITYAYLVKVPKLALTSPTSGGRSVGIVRLRTKATE
jgi:hypothetical protein